MYEDGTGHAIDQICENFIQGAQKEGFLVRCARDSDKGEFAIKLSHELPPVDDRLALPDLPAHNFGSVKSVAAYLHKYGNQDGTVVFVSDEKVVAVLNEQVEAGSRSLLTCQRRSTRLFQAWSELIGRQIEPQKLRAALLPLRITMPTPQILTSLNQIQYRSEVQIERDHKDDGAVIGLVFKANGGEKMQEFPKQIAIRVPVLPEDMLEPSRWVSTTVRLELCWPEGEGERLTILLACDDLDTLALGRWRQSVDEAFHEMPDWMILDGDPGYSRQSFARVRVADRIT